MPEAPDLEVFSKNLHKLFAGKQLKQVKIVRTKNLEDDTSVFEKKLKNLFLEEIYRAGKELRFRFSNKIILGMHLMLHGKLYLFEGENQHKNTIAEFYFDGKGLALTDYQGAANIKLDPEEKKGTDALSPALDFDTLKKGLQSTSKIKARLINQDVIRGIGNAYADEILWEVKIDPASISNKIPDDKINALLHAIKDVLINAEKEILKSDPNIIAGEIRHFLKVHNSKKEKSPTGATIKVDKKGGTTYYTEEQELFK